MKTIVLAVLLLFSGFVVACDDECIRKKDNGGIKWNNSFIFNSSYQDISSEYYKLGKSKDSISSYSLDWNSDVGLTDRLSLTTTVRAINRDYSTNLSGSVDPRDPNRITNEEYSDAHFRALYLTYKLPETEKYSHMVAFGTMPFQGGAWTQYKNGTPQSANGLSMMFDMPFDALVYVGDLTKYSDADMLQFRIGVGEYMKFRKLYPQDMHLGLTPYDTTIGFMNLDYKKGPHNLKAEFYNTNWVFESAKIGTAQQLGFGYAYDRMEDDGYVMYGTVAFSKATGSYNDYIKMKMTQNKDKLIAGTMAQYGVDYSTASGIIDRQLANITPEFISSATDVTLPDTGLVQGKSTTGWAFKVGAKKEFWVEKFDVDWFVGMEYFKSSKDWVATTLRGFPRNGIDPLIKGQAIDLYTGIKFDDGKILTLSFIHEDRKWTPTSINDVVGISPSDTNRNPVTKRNIIRLDFTWMFLGL